MKKTLTFTLWPEPPRPLAPMPYQSWVKRQIISLISKPLERQNLVLSRELNRSTEQRVNGTFWPVYADTMVGVKRLDNLQECIETVLREGIEGDFIETGVWRGGSCIFMRAVLEAYGIRDRRIFLADSFEGLPKPKPEKYPADLGDTHHKLPHLAVSQEEVEDNFRKDGLLDDRVVFIKGWFSETLPNAPIKALSIMRLDGDMYESTMDALRNLYHKLSPGGFCIIDDYALEGCKMAVDDFRSQNNITEQIREIDWSGTYWIKKKA